MAWNQISHYQCEKLGKKYLQVTLASYLWDLVLFRMFTYPSFQIELHLWSNVLFSGFQSSLVTLKSTE